MENSIDLLQITKSKPWKRKKGIHKSLPWDSFWSVQQYTIRHQLIVKGHERQIGLEPVRITVPFQWAVGTK